MWKRAAAVVGRQRVVRCSPAHAAVHAWLLGLSVFCVGALLCFVLVSHTSGLSI